MWAFLSYLFAPKTLQKAIHKSKVRVTGCFVLLLVLLLTLITVLPIFGILFFKILHVESITETSFLEAMRGSFYRAFRETVFLMICLPAIKWWGQSWVIKRCLRSKRYGKTFPRFSIVLLARSFGLLPMLFLLPLKVLMFPPADLTRHIFFPPLSSFFLTSFDRMYRLPDHRFWSFFLLNRPSEYVRPSFYLSIILLVLTFFLTIRKMIQLTGLSFDFVFFRVFLAVVLWDGCLLALLVLFSSVSF